MTFPRRLSRAVIAALCAATLVLLPAAVGGATAETTPESTTEPTTTTPLTMVVSPSGAVSYKRLAAYGHVPVEVKTSGAAQVHFDVLVPAAVGRALRLKMAKGAKTAVFAKTDVTAKGPGYAAGLAPFSKAVAKRLAAKPRAFTATVVATSGSVRATGTVRVNKKD